MRRSRAEHSVSKEGARSEIRGLLKGLRRRYYASLALKRDGKAIVTDACVPISRLADVVKATAADVKAAGVVGPCFGHAGDGNFHCLGSPRPPRPPEKKKTKPAKKKGILVYNDDDSPEYVAALHEVNAKLVQRALDAGGTCTGEHGVGAGKRKALVRERGAAGVAAMRAVKAALDPRGIMNPGKVV